MAAYRALETNRNCCAVATQDVSKRNPCWPAWRPAGGRGQCVYACHRALESSVAQTDASDFIYKINNSRTREHSFKLFSPDSRANCRLHFCYSCAEDSLPEEVVSADYRVDLTQFFWSARLTYFRVFCSYFIVFKPAIRTVYLVCSNLLAGYACKRLCTSFSHTIRIHFTALISVCMLSEPCKNC